MKDEFMPLEEREYDPAALDDLEARLREVTYFMLENQRATTNRVISQATEVALTQGKTIYQALNEVTKNV